MASLAEIRARKLAESSKEVAVSPDKESSVTVAAIKTIPDPVKAEETPVIPEKPLTFAERMALKKKQEEAAKNPPATPITTLDPDKPTEVVATVQQIENNVVEKLRTGMLDASLDKNPMPPPDPVKPEDSVDPQVAQAYADIKSKLDLLVSMSDEDLPSAMSSLKKALMSNPAAVSLMLDADIAQMVIALRRITGEAITEAAKEKKPGRKTKEKTIDLTDPNVVQSVIDEL
jgi:hypothetical protein